MSYTKDNAGNEKYTKDQATGNQIIEHKRYARNANGESYYPTLGTGDQQMDTTLGYIRRGGRLILPLSKDGKPIYKKDSSLNEEYPVDNNQDVYGVGSDGHEYYAKKSTNDEFYPKGNVLATRVDGTPYYAQTSNGQTVFPVKDNKQVYAFYVNPNKKYTIPTRYASEGANEFYPKTITADGFLSDYILGDKYAQKGGVDFYPKDAFHNEFYLPDRKVAGNAVRTVAEMIVTGANRRYAVTNDKKIILPSLNNQVALDATLAAPAVAANQVIGRLVREDVRMSGFLTSVENTAAPDVEARAYRYVNEFAVIQEVKPAGSKDPDKPLKSMCTSRAGCFQFPTITTWWFWILIILSLILKGFAIWWFLIREKDTKSSYGTVK